MEHKLILSLQPGSDVVRTEFAAVPVQLAMSTGTPTVSPTIASMKSANLLPPVACPKILAVPKIQIVLVTHAEVKALLARILWLWHLLLERVKLQE